MNLSGLVAALLPVFFVLALGYGAGKRNAFDANQAAGLSKLAGFVRIARVPIRRYDRYTQGSASATGPTRSGADSGSCRPFFR